MINHDDPRHEVRSIKTINDTPVEHGVLLMNDDWRLDLEVIDDRPNCPWLIGFGQTHGALMPITDYEWVDITEVDELVTKRSVNQVWLNLITYARVKSVELFGP